MGLRFQHWALTGLSGVLLALVAVNIWLYVGNQERQREVNNRQAFIQQGQQLDALYREIAQALATLAVTKGDKPLQQLLANQGIKINVGQAPGARPADTAEQDTPALRESTRRERGARTPPASAPPPAQ